MSLNRTRIEAWFSIVFVDTWLGGLGRDLQFKLRRAHYPSVECTRSRLYQPSIDDGKQGHEHDADPGEKIGRFFQGERFSQSTQITEVGGAGKCLRRSAAMLLVGKRPDSK